MNDLKIGFILLTIVTTLAILPAHSFVAAANSNQSITSVDQIDTAPSNHPSGKDRNTEQGNSYPQGNSHSNPDGGGVDKPYDSNGQPAGSQGRNDYDGNNGCGNDNDFSDDNNGKCLGRSKKIALVINPTPTPTPGSNSTSTSTSSNNSSDNSNSSNNSSNNNSSSQTNNPSGGVVIGATKLPSTGGFDPIFGLIAGLMLIGFGGLRYVQTQKNFKA